jgi:hypothetical protein
VDKNQGKERGQIMMGIHIWLLASLCCLVMTCTIPHGFGNKQAVVRLDGVEISCAIPKKDFIVRERQVTDDRASLTFDCPTIKTQNGYSVVPVFSLHIEKADSMLDPVVYNNRSRALYEARTIAVLTGPQCLLGGVFIELVQQRKYGAIQNKIYQATTTRGEYGVRVVYQVPSEVYDQGYGEIRQVIKTIKVAQVEKK